MDQFCDLTLALQKRLEQLHTLAPESIGDWMHLELVTCEPEAGIYVMRCSTYDWMRNIAGTLHGGMCATLVDQAMGCVAYCAKPGEGIAPTVELNVGYHRPLIPGKNVRISIRLVSVSRSLMHLAAEAFLEDVPEKLCISASAVYFYRPKTE